MYRISLHIIFVWWDWSTPPGDISMVETGVTSPPNQRLLHVIFMYIIFIRSVQIYEYKDI